MVYAGQMQNRRTLTTTAVASTLLFISCVDGFLKNTHGNTIFYVLKDFALLALVVAMVFTLAVRPWERPKGKWQGLWAWGLYIGYMSVQVLNPGSRSEEHTSELQS